MQLTTVFHLLFFNMHSKSPSTIFHSRPKFGTHIFHPNYLFITAIYIVRLYCSLFSFFMKFSALSRSCVCTPTLYSYMLSSSVPLTHFCGYSVDINKIILSYLSRGLELTPIFKSYHPFSILVVLLHPISL
jgi:hypothetical protein